MTKDIGVIPFVFFLKLPVLFKLKLHEIGSKVTKNQGLGIYFILLNLYVKNLVSGLKQCNCIALIL